jgi:HD superfamily phosphohydrolase
MAKYYMTANVYRHKVRLITDQMISRAIALGIECDQIDELNSLYRYDSTDSFVANYMRWDDARFMLEFADPKYEGKLCYKLVCRLKERRLFKRVFREQFKQLPEVSREPLLKIFDDEAGRASLEAAFAEAINETIEDHIDPRFVIVNPVTVKLDSESAKNDGANILVDFGPIARTFETVSALFQALSKGFDEKYLEVYAPVTWANPIMKRKTLSKLDASIRLRLEAFTPLAPKGEWA